MKNIDLMASMLGISRGDLLFAFAWIGAAAISLGFVVIRTTYNTFKK